MLYLVIIHLGDWLGYDATFTYFWLDIFNLKDFNPFNFPLKMPFFLYLCLFFVYFQQKDLYTTYELIITNNLGRYQIFEKNNLIKIHDKS